MRRTAIIAEQTIHNTPRIPKVLKDWRRREKTEEEAEKSKTEEIELPEISTPVGLLDFIPLFTNLRYQKIVERSRAINPLILDRDGVRLSFNLGIGI